MATFTVTTDDDIVDDGDGVVSLREAIALANGRDGLDVIVFDLESSERTLRIDEDLEFTITDALEINGAGVIAIDADSGSRIFDILEDAPVTLRGLTLEEGSVTGEGGGAVRSTSDLALIDVTITGSETRGNDNPGGAIFVEGDLTIENSVFEDNQTLGVDSRGGAIYARGDVAISGSAFDSNMTAGDDAEGGAVASTGSVTVTGSDFIGNRTEGDGSDGGALFVEDALSISGGLFDDNTTDGEDARGGGVFVDDDVTIDGTVFRDNATGAGAGAMSGARSTGGAVSAGGEAIISNASFENNSTEGVDAPGGAVFADGTVAVTESAFTANTTAGTNSGGGAIRGDSLTASGTDFAMNVTAGAQSPGGAVASDGAITVTGGTLTNNRTSGDGSAGGALSGTEISIANPAASVTGNTTSGANAPGGAVAASAGLTVSNATFDSNGTTGDGSTGGTLSALGAATLDFVVIGAGTTVGADAGGGALHAGGAVAITESTFQGNATAGDRSGGGAIAGLTAVTIDNSFIDGNATAGDNAPGGGLDAGGAVVIRGTTVSNNATDGLAARGGGINADGRLTVLNTTVNGNETGGTGGQGGGIFAGGASILTNVTLAANTTRGVDAAGGGLFAGGALTALNITVTGNLTQGAASPGGGIFADTARALGDSIVLGNVSTSGTTLENDIADGDDVTASALGVNITGGGSTTAEDVFASTFVLAGGIAAGQLADNGGRVGTVALLGQSSNPALDAGRAGALAEGVAGEDLNADGDLFDVIATDARGTGFARVIDIPGLGNESSGVSDIGAFEAAEANRAPIALDDGLTLDEGSNPVTVDILDNDRDLDPGTVLTVTDIAVPDGFMGRVEYDDATGVLTYDPQGLFANLSGSERVVQTVTYTLSDNDGGTDTATVTVTVQGVNASPIAADDTVEVGAQSDEIAIPVTENDADPDRLDSIRIASIDTEGTFGMASISEDGLSILYDPAGAFDGISPGGVAVDTIEYQLTDGNGGSDTATLEVRVRGEEIVNADPAAVDDTLLTVSGAVAAIDPLADNGGGVDSDPDGDPVTLDSIADPENGILLALEDGRFLYRSDQGFAGTETVAYTISDGRGGTATGEIAISVAAPMAETSLGLGAAQRVAYTYEAALDRDGEIDTAGLNFWIRARYEGIGDQDPLSEQDLAQAFLTSPEFILTFGDPTQLTDRELVEVLYRNVLDRDGEEAGIQFWVDALAQESFGRTDVLIAFAASPENLTGSPDITSLTEVEPGVWDFVA